MNTITKLITTITITSSLLMLSGMVAAKGAVAYPAAPLLNWIGVLPNGCNDSQCKNWGNKCIKDNNKSTKNRTLDNKKLQLQLICTSVTSTSNSNGGATITCQSSSGYTMKCIGKK